MPTITISQNTGADYTGISAAQPRESQPTTNYYNQVAFECTAYNSFDRRHVLFSITNSTGISGPVTVTGATLGIQCNDNGGTNTNDFDIHEVIVSAITTQATWDDRLTATAWTSNGGLNSTDVNMAPVASVTNVVTSGVTNFSSAALDSLVEDMLNGVTSEILLLMVRNPDTAYDFTYNVFDGVGNTTSGPVLTVPYTSGGGATTGALSSTGLGTGLFRSQSSVNSAVSAAGVATGTFRSQSTTASPFTSAGTSTVTWVGRQSISAAMTSAGTSAVTWNATSSAASPFTAAGVATANWNAVSTTQARVTAAGTSTVTWVGTAQADGAGELHSAGASTFLLGAQSSIGAGLSAAGFSTVAWAGAASIDAQISSSGTSTVTWEGAEITPSIASGAFSMAGSSSVRWIGRNVSAVTSTQEGRKRRRIDDDEEEIMQIISALAPAVFEQWYD